MQWCILLIIPHSVGWEHWEVPSQSWANHFTLIQAQILSSFIPTNPYWPSGELSGQKWQQNLSVGTGEWETETQHYLFASYHKYLHSFENLNPQNLATDNHNPIFLDADT